MEKVKPLNMLKSTKRLFLSEATTEKKISESPMGVEPTTLHSHVVQMRYPWSRGTLVGSLAIFLG